MRFDTDRRQSDVLIAIGNRLRDLREERGMSMREAASRAGISASFIGLVERGESEIAITRMMRLVDVYGVTVATVLGDTEATQAGSPTHLEDARTITADNGRVQIRYLTIPMPSVEPFRLELKPDASIDGLEHATPEFFHCVAGSPTMLLGREEFVLEPGDSILVPADIPHGWRNPTDETCVLVGAVERSGEQTLHDHPG
jgi:transcriptional regulator with XRE-family HTH domain